MWEALTHFLNISKSKSSSDERYLNVTYLFHPRGITFVITINCHLRLLRVVQKIMFLCIMMCREVCRMLLVYSEVHIYCCLFALEFLKGWLCLWKADEKLNKRRIQGAAHQAACDLVLLVPKGKTLQRPCLSALQWGHLVLNNGIYKIYNSDFKEASTSTVVMCNWTVTEVDVGNESYAFFSEKHFSVFNTLDLPNAVCLPSFVSYL